MKRTLLIAGVTLAVLAASAAEAAASTGRILGKA